MAILSLFLMLAFTFFTGLGAALPAAAPSSPATSPAPLRSMGSCSIINPTDDFVESWLSGLVGGYAGNAEAEAKVDNNEDPVQYGGTSLFNYDDGPIKWGDETWPGITLIPYCFESEQSRIDGKDRVEAAVKLWIDALGGERSPSSGHSLKIIEWYNYAKFEPFYCFGSSQANQQWNPSLRTDTVAIAMKKICTTGLRNYGKS
jgi:hypothetical protein